ncbi:MAG: hypothetical protein V1876_02390 [Candidatus Peregrinibacteria bacterium]
MTEPTEEEMRDFLRRQLSEPDMAPAEETDDFIEQVLQALRGV